MGQPATTFWSLGLAGNRGHPYQLRPQHTIHRERSQPEHETGNHGVIPSNNTSRRIATGAAPNAIRTPISCTLCPIDRGQGLLLAALGGLVSIAQACMKLHEG